MKAVKSLAKDERIAPVQSQLAGFLPTSFLLDFLIMFGVGDPATVPPCVTADRLRKVSIHVSILRVRKLDVHELFRSYECISIYLYGTIM